MRPESWTPGRARDDGVDGPFAMPLNLSKWIPYAWLGLLDVPNMGPPAIVSTGTP